MHRFFIPPEWIGPRFVTLQGQVAHQIINVLRMREGARICVLDNTGWEYEVELGLLTRSEAQGTVVRRTLAKNEPRTKITVYQALLKADRFETVIQKCTELGAVSFVPLVTARTVVGAVGEIDSPRVRRWQRVAIEAAEQSGRGRLPTIHPAMLFQNACETVSGFSLIPWEEEQTRSIRSVLQQTFGPREGTAANRPFSVNLFIGPEGGFTPEEVRLARRFDIVPVTMGRRILRAETAAIVATAAVLYEAGDMGE
jgi:16S rRNA (uracil1498-N3)-methyltransferase